MRISLLWTLDIRYIRGISHRYTQSWTHNTGRTTKIKRKKITLRHRTDAGETKSETSRTIWEVINSHQLAEEVSLELLFSVCPCRRRIGVRRELQGFGWISAHVVGRQRTHWFAHFFQSEQYLRHHIRRRGAFCAGRVWPVQEVVLAPLPRYPEGSRLLEVHCWRMLNWFQLLYITSPTRIAALAIDRFLVTDCATDSRVRRGQMVNSVNADDSSLCIVAAMNNCNSARNIRLSISLQDVVRRTRFPNVTDLRQQRTLEPLYLQNDPFSSLYKSRDISLTRMTGFSRWSIIYNYAWYATSLLMTLHAVGLFPYVLCNVLI